MIDLKVFPPELNLFGAESDWRVNDRVAIIRGAKEENLDKAEIILELNGFTKRDLDEELLERYFTRRDEMIIEEEPLSIAVGEVIMPMEVTARAEARAVEVVEAEKLEERELIEHILRYIKSRGYNYPGEELLYIAEDEALRHSNRIQRNG